MIKTKHLTQPAATDDGPRLWVEPVGMCKDLRAWCSVDLLLPDVAPPRVLWEWFQEHPNGAAYVLFRRAYHRHLQSGPLRAALERLAAAGATSYLTLLHQGDNLDCNTATALRELLEDISTRPPSARQTCSA